MAINLKRNIMKTRKKADRVYEVVGRTTGSHSTALKIEFVAAKSKEAAKSKSKFDYVKTVHWRKDIKPNEI